MNRQIDYDLVMDNLNHLINTLEYDAMRSPGKVKQAAAELNACYQLKDRYEADMKPTAPVVELKVKPGPKPKEAINK